MQETWLGDLLSILEAPIPAFVPMIVFSILFAEGATTPTGPGRRSF